MVIRPLIPAEFYLIDCSSIMAFSGADYADPDRFIAYRDKIWTHLETMLDSGRLKTVSQAWIELEYNDGESYERLKPKEGKLILPADDSTDFRVLNLISRHPKLIDDRQSYTREPADPYLIVYAQKWGVTIISDEKPVSERKGKRKSRRHMIPDICPAEGVRCIRLEKFLKEEGVIPLDF